MNLRALGTLLYIIYFLIVTFPQRLRLKKEQETNPEKCHEIATAQIKKALRNIMKIAGIRVETDGLDNIP